MPVHAREYYSHHAFVCSMLTYANVCYNVCWPMLTYARKHMPESTSRIMRFFQVKPSHVVSGEAESHAFVSGESQVTLPLAYFWETWHIPRKNVPVAVSLGCRVFGHQ
jgi:hypothetical protein